MFSEGDYRRANFVSLKIREREGGEQIFMPNCSVPQISPSIEFIYIKFPSSFEISNLLLKSSALLMYTNIRSKSYCEKVCGYVL